MVGRSEDPLTIEEILLEGVLGGPEDVLTIEEIFSVVGLAWVLGGVTEDPLTILEGVADPLAMEEIFPAGVVTVALMLIVGDGELDGARE